MYSQLRYPAPIEEAIVRIENLLTLDYQRDITSQGYQVSKRSIALVLLQNDTDLWEEVKYQEPQFLEIEQVVRETREKLEDSPAFVIARVRYELAAKIEQKVIAQPPELGETENEWLHKLTINPIAGFPILLLVLYLGVYQFVGVFGAGTLVHWLEPFFEGTINPVINHMTAEILPGSVLQNLLANDYGIITLGMRYAIAIVFPVVSTFFFMFSLLEDSGYLPRLSLLADRLFKMVGLEGRAVIPMVMGLSCSTMATSVNHSLQNKQERAIATILLVLAIPGSAQIGVLLGLLSQNPIILLIWGCCIGVIFIIVGFLSYKILPSESSSFSVEIPPLRLPRPKATLTKTYVRLRGYFGKILPLFVLASILIWLGQITGLFDLLVSDLKPVMLWLGLPAEAAPAFLYGIFRRDYGAAGLFDLRQHGMLNGEQLVVAAVTVTLFVPCLAQFRFVFKERGIKTALAIAAAVFTFAFLMGYALHQILTVFGGEIFNV